MKRFAISFMMVFGLALSVQPVQAEDLPVKESDGTVLEHVTSKGFVTEELPLLENGEEDPVLEEAEKGEVIERGTPRFKLKKRPRKRITLPPKSRIQLNQMPANKRRLLPRIPQKPGQTNKPPQPGGEKGQAVSPPPSQCVIQTSDIIDPRIENGDIGDGNTTKGAQESLMRVMQHGSVEERRVASSIIMAIKSEQLAGVHAPDMGRKASADRAVILPPVGTKGYWNLLSPGQVGLCLREPAGVPPMLLYRQKNMPPGAVEHTLVTSWAQCGLPTRAMPCAFVVDLHKPPPQPGSTDEQSEGSGQFQVLVQGGGKALGGVHVSVIANRKEPLGFQNFQNESDPGTTVVRSGVTNSEGMAIFVLPPLGPGIQIHVTAPPGFSSASLAVMGLILDKRTMIELIPNVNPANGGEQGQATSGEGAVPGGVQGQHTSGENG